MDSVKEKMSLRTIKVVEQYREGLLTLDELGDRILEAIMDYYEELVS